MNKKIKYFIDTIRAKFDSQLKIVNSKIKWIQYALFPTNTIYVKDSSISHFGVECKGKNNRLQILGGANLCYSSVGITGNDNEVILDGCTGIINITVNGNSCKVYIGKNTSMEDLYLICMGKQNSVTIGEDCMIAGKVEIWNSDTHLITDFDNKPLNPSKPITIGNHVWLGKYAKVLKGVTMADGSIAGMGSVVTRDVPANSIAVGNPAKVVKSGVMWHKGYIKI